MTTTLPTPPKPRRRWLQFSLRALLVLIILICVFLALAMRFGVLGVSAFLFLLGALVFGRAMRGNHPTMATIACMLMLFSIVPPAVWDMGSRWIGHRSHSLLVRVVDSRSGGAIAGASIRILDPDVDPNASGVQTDMNGTATVTTVLTIVGTDNLLWDRGSLYLGGYGRTDGTHAGDPR